MTNRFAGLQFSNRPRDSWGARGDSYEDWTDFIGTNANPTFSADTRLRIKPTTNYYLSVNGGNNALYRSVENLMADAEKHIRAGSSVDLSSALSTDFTKIPNLQYRQPKSKGYDWFVLNLNTMPTVLAAETELRIRPDHYHVVDSLDPVVKGSVAFHDIEELAKYVDNRIRTSGLDFSVKKVKYGN